MISIVIPLYNKAHTIVSTLSSVFNQTYTDYEIIIVNDGSTDESVKVINNFTSDNRVRIVNQINKGVSAARNKGVSLASFDYIAFLDGDDEWTPEYLAKMKEAIDSHPKAGLFCSAGIIRNADGSEIYRVANKYKSKILKIDFFENPHVFIHTSAAIVSKKSFNNTSGFPDNIWDEDFCLFFSIALIEEVIYSGYPYSVYVGGVEGQSTSVKYREDGSLRKDSIPRHNLVYINWIRSGCANKSYTTFLKYEIRHTIKIALQERNYELITKYYKELSPEIKKHFSPFEFFLYKNRYLRSMSILQINLYKLIWRTKGYPYVGQKLDE